MSSNLVALELGGGVTSMEGLLTFGIGNSNPSLSLNILDVAGLLVLLSNEDAFFSKKRNHKKIVIVSIVGFFYINVIKIMGDIIWICLKSSIVLILGNLFLPHHCTDLT